MPSRTFRVLLVLAVAGALPIAGEAQTADPQLLVLSCAGCHGPGGRSPGAIPSLHGQTAASIADHLRGFRDDRLPSTVMGRIAKGYSDAEIDALANTMAASWK
jgi:sulfide dehydrogenase cytochrome subunit